MTQRHRDQERLRDRANLQGVGRGYHLLDDRTGDEFGRDPETRSGGHEGLAGIHDVRQEIGYKRLLEELNWWIAHADGVEPGILSPMKTELDIPTVFSLARLTKEQSEAWALRVEGHTLARIAECLDISLGAVQSRLNWGRVKLKVWVSDHLLDST